MIINRKCILMVIQDFIPRKQRHRKYIHEKTLFIVQFTNVSTINIYMCIIWADILFKSQRMTKGGLWHDIIYIMTSLMFLSLFPLEPKKFLKFM